jgi:fluoroquinolone transport system ATP-binding protein
MISVENLMFSYPGSSKPAVNSISFSLPSGEIFGLLGPNGAGKSTTQRILIGILTHFSGNVSVLNKDLHSWGKDLYDHVGIVFEVPNFYSKLTAIENLEFFGSFHRKKVVPPLDLLRMVGLEQDGNKKVGEYSKGMKVRLNFVRALQHNPDILFLDEPTSGLDPLNRKIVIDLIFAQKKAGKTILISTHNMHDTEELCDRVAFIVEGKIVVIEKPQELKIQAGQKKVIVGTRSNGALAYTDFPLKDLGRNQEFLKFIQTHEIENIHSQDASLDEVFIRITGKQL